MNRLVVKRFVEITVTMLVLTVVLFASSGRVDWVWAWIYVAITIGGVIINTLIFLPTNRGLIAERAEAKENTKSWDRVLTKILLVPYFCTFLLAGLDIRFGWSPQFALATQLIAAVFVVAGYGLVTWAMVSNKFFSGTVRIQKDRGHAVATAGPYQYVRHPGYVGMLAYSLATPLLLGSLWALVPSAFIVCGLIIRTSLEDKMLQEELDGYRDYAQRVRSRLVPGIW